jgi:tetratricopeptide (TPR) repeat protein
MVQKPAAPGSRNTPAGAHTGSAGKFLQQAAHAYEAGQHDRAELILRQVVEQRPDDGRAWHLRGLNAFAAGRPVDALDCFIRAVACEKENAAYCAALAEALSRLGRDADALEPWQRAAELDPHNARWPSELAQCLSRLGRHGEAIPLFQSALQRSPGDAKLLAAYGYALHCEGRIEEAAERYRDALAADPLLHQARLNLAAILRKQGDQEAAVEQCRHVLRHDPRSVSALNNLGAALCSLGRNVEAVRQLKAALQIEPKNLTTLHNLGVALHAAGAPAEAEIAFRNALKINDKFSDAQRSLANLLRGTGRLEEAAVHYRAVIDQRPLDFMSYGNLALILLNLNKPQEAIAVYEKALALRPERPDLRMSLGIAQLLVGDFANGWANYEARWSTDMAPAWRPDFGAPLWNGEPLGDASSGDRPTTILVHAEQGFGDSLHFCRYIPLLAATGARVVFECQPSLAALMATLPARDARHALRIISRDEAAPAADYHVPLLSFPRIFNTTLDSIPARVPYLSAPPSKSVAWADFPSGDGPSVGLVWSGNPQRQDDHMRSCPPDALVPLLELENVRFYGLAKDAPPMEKSRITDLGPRLADFGDTAAVVEKLDLVISVDTAAAHLAGALGRPVWVMLGFAADWRYLLDREDSPWYPTMRLFRQDSPGDWLSVTRRIADELRRAFQPKR